MSRSDHIFILWVRFKFAARGIKPIATWTAQETQVNRRRLALRGLRDEDLERERRSRAGRADSPDAARGLQSIWNRAQQGPLERCFR